MNTLLLAMELAKKITHSQIRVLEYFIQHPIFEGSYRELSYVIYGKPNQQSNARKFVMELQDMGILMVAVNDDCCCFDTKRTYIQLNAEWEDCFENLTRKS